VLPRAQQAINVWLQQLESRSDLRWLIPAHYSAPLTFTAQQAAALRTELQQKNWAPNEGNWSFLGSIDQRLLKLGVVPEKPLQQD
jgi:hypothetical protein